MTIYLGFFGFKEPPFNPTPDPRFLHLTPAHKEALAQLVYGVQGRKGFTLLTGEVGTGKTTLLQTLLRRLDEHTAVAFVTNSMLGFEGLLEYLLEDLGIAKGGESHAQRVFALQHFLTERRRAGQDTVLILDEAQDFDVRCLEQIRLLSNFETPTEKILQIVLVGQPELRAKLELPELRQLKQRIALRCTIPPLALDEVDLYIRTRLRVAGSPDLRLFTDEAVTRIARYSGGIPRLISTVCDHCLMFGYADKVRRIDAGIVKEVIQYLEAGEPRRRQTGRAGHGRWRMTPLRWSLVGGLVAAAFGLAGLEATHPAMLRHALDLCASSLTDLARPARALLGL
jgi:general secretion pathway protein A